MTKFGIVCQTVKFKIVLLMSIFVFAGCFGHPMPVNKIFKANMPTEDVTVYVNRVLMCPPGNPLHEGVDAVWIVHADGMVWQLSGLAYTPKDWKLIRYTADGYKEQIPLEFAGFTMKDPETKMPTQWNLQSQSNICREE